MTKKRPNHPMRVFVGLASTLIVLQGCATSDGRAGLAPQPAPILNIDKGFEYRTRFTYVATEAPTVERPYYLMHYRQAIDTAAARNDIIRDLQAAVDASYHYYESKLRLTRAGGNLAFAVVDAGLDLASIAAPGAAQLLSAIDLFFADTQKAIDLEFFADQTMQAIQMQMRTDRANVMVTISLGLDDTVDNYPLEQGLADIIRYYWAGTVTNALLSLVEQTGGMARDAQETARQVDDALRINNRARLPEILESR